MPPGGEWWRWLFCPPLFAILFNLVDPIDIYLLRVLVCTWTSIFALSLRCLVFPGHVNTHLPHTVSSFFLDRPGTKQFCPGYEGNSGPDNWNLFAISIKQYTCSRGWCRCSNKHDSSSITIWFPILWTPLARAMRAETNPIGNQDIWVRSYKYSKAYETCIESQNGKDMRNLADQARNWGNSTRDRGAIQNANDVKCYSLGDIRFLGKNPNGQWVSALGVGILIGRT